jgi:UV DNA damage endonuclease
MRLGLCCKFYEQDIKFRITTARYLSTLSKKKAVEKLSDICLHNAQSLLKSLQYCREHGIGCFRINSQILPLKTHPDAGYDIEYLPDAALIVETFSKCGSCSRENDIRTSFHPDQFILLNSPGADVVERSIMELEYHSRVAGWVGADVINIHAGGAYGDKTAALKRLKEHVRSLPESVRSRLTFENDDKIYTPSELLGVCHDLKVPLVYDVHHHRCLPDGMSEKDATARTIETWNREPLFHISSSIEGWSGPGVHRHHDYIDPSDFPDFWKGMDITVEVEAKAKELAVLRLARDLDMLPMTKKKKFTILRKV